MRTISTPSQDLQHQNNVGRHDLRPILWPSRRSDSPVHRSERNVMEVQQISVLVELMGTTHKVVTHVAALILMKSTKSS